MVGLAVAEFGMPKLGGGMEKQRLWKLWKMGGSKKDYLVVKKCVKWAVHNAKKVAQETRFSEINTKKDCNRIFKLAKKRKVNNNVIGDKYVKDKDNNLALGDKEKLCAWKAYYE